MNNFLEWIKENYGGSAISPSSANEAEPEKIPGAMPTYELPKNKKYKKFKDWVGGRVSKINSKKV